MLVEKDEPRPGHSTEGEHQEGQLSTYIQTSCLHNLQQNGQPRTVNLQAPANKELCLEEIEHQKKHTHKNPRKTLKQNPRKSSEHKRATVTEFWDTVA